MTGGYKLFEGVVTAYIREEKWGFIWGESRFEGVNEFKGHRFKVWFKNENQISWFDDEPFVTCPDLICVVDSVTGQGLSNFWLNDFRRGRRVTIIGIKLAQAWRTERGLKIYNPRHFGFHIRYVPVEELAKRLDNLLSGN